VEFVQGIQDAWAWLVERWGTGADPLPWMMLVALAVIVATAFVHPLWRAARNAVTIVHEMGHVVVARLCGRRIQGIRLHSDTSGLAITKGRPRGFGVLLTSLAGYPAPGLVGAAMTWAAFAGHAGAALLLFAVLLLLALLLVRNAWGALTVTVSLAIAGFVLWRDDPSIVTTVVLALGLFLAVGSFRASCDLARAHARGRAPQSDAKSAAANSKLPAPLWLGFFLVVTALCALNALWLTVSMLWAAR